MGWWWTSEQTVLLRAVDARVTILLRKVSEATAALDDLRREQEEMAVAIAAIQPPIPPDTEV